MLNPRPARPDLFCGGCSPPDTFSEKNATNRQAFQINPHNLDVEKHVANMSDPAILATPAPAVAGIVSPHDFRPARCRGRTSSTFGSGSTT